MPTLDVDLFQSLDNGSHVASAVGTTAATCDGTPQSAPVPLTLSSGAQILAGWASLHVTLGAVDRSADVMVLRTSVVAPTPDPTPTQPPAPVKAEVSLTTNASPESVIKGKTVTIVGTIRRDGKKFKAKTRLEFSPDSGGGYAKVKSVTSSKSGKLSTTVKASRSGAFRYAYAGSATSAPATSGGDHIVVKPKPKPLPKPKAYKNCTALHKVYPHGVGKSGAKDRGGDVTTFTRDNKTYAKNKKSDRDKDGIACEQD